MKNLEDFDIETNQNIAVTIILSLLQIPQVNEGAMKHINKIFLQITSEIKKYYNSTNFNQRFKSKHFQKYILDYEGV